MHFTGLYNKSKIIKNRQEKSSFYFFFYQYSRFSDVSTPPPHTHTLLLWKLQGKLKNDLLNLILTKYISQDLKRLHGVGIKYDFRTRVLLAINPSLLYLFCFCVVDDGSTAMKMGARITMRVFLSHACDKRVGEGRFHYYYFFYYSFLEILASNSIAHNFAYCSHSSSSRGYRNEPVAEEIM